VANLGHGLSPSHDPAKVGRFFRSVQDISADMNRGAQGKL
jgi:hypothetical protein